MFDNFIDGTAVLAPSLFPNPMEFAVIGLWQVRVKGTAVKR
jgi:hypothetical protein